MRVFSKHQWHSSPALKSFIDDALGYDKNRNYYHLDTPQILQLLTKSYKEVQDYYHELIKKFCWELGIAAKDKTDRESLPYKEELNLDELYMDRFFGSPYHKTYIKAIMKEILEKDLQKFRFYVFVNIPWNYDYPKLSDEEKWENETKLEFRFRYFPH